MTEHPLLDHIKIDYHSSYATHKMIIPTRVPVPGAGAGDTLGYTAWDASTVTASDMVATLVANLVKKFPSTVFFDLYTAMMWDAGGVTWNPVEVGAIADGAGIDDDPGWTQAVESIFTMYDSGFNTVKLNLLDTSSRNNFAARTPLTADADELAIVAEFKSPTNAWASRAQLQPTTLRTIKLGINDELKKQYPGI